MERKRSKGVTVLGVLTIIFSLTSIPAWNYKDFSTIYNSFPHFIILILFIYTILYVPLGIIAGIGILKLNNIARKLAITITAINLFIFVLTVFGLDGIKAFIQKEYQGVNLTNIIPEATFLNICLGVIYFGFTIGFIYEIIYLYFFTRPKIKEQFK